MKTWIINGLAGVALLSTNPATFAQTNPQILHLFNGDLAGFGAQAPPILSSNTFFGTAAAGGSVDGGIVYRISTDGSGFMILHNFGSNQATGPFDRLTNADGIVPAAGLALAGNTLIGTTADGGQFGLGTIFGINVDGTGFSVLHNFTGLEGGDGWGTLAVSGNTIYGGTGPSGSTSNGILFRIDADGSNFTNLYTFSGSNGSGLGGTLAVSGNTLYGTTGGGDGNSGTVFKINTDGSGFTNLHIFTNTDGSGPEGVILSGNTLYGAAQFGGGNGAGTVFAINTDGSGFTNLYRFDVVDSMDGFALNGPLAIIGCTLYGTTQSGGANSQGILYSININGSGFTKLYDFPNDTNTGGGSVEGVVSLGNTLYGVTKGGWYSNIGTLFAFTLPTPALGIASAGNQSVLYFTPSGPNYVLQSTTDLSSGTWTNATDATPVVGFTVSNQSQARFFRLQPQ